MRRVFLAAAVFFAAVAAFADDPSAKPVKAGFIGEGGGYKAPDQATEQYQVGDQAPPPSAAAPAAAVPAPAVPADEAAPPPQAAPAAPAARSVSPGAAARAVAAVSRRGESIPPEAKPAARRSLWNGLVQPLAMTAASVAAETDPDAARADADRDYETRILGMKSGPAHPALSSRPMSASAASNASAAAARAAGGKLFVSLALDSREAGSLRDAVAGLGAAVGFSPDARFEAMPGPDGTVLYSGWIPAGRLGDAAMRPGVRVLRVEARPLPSNPRETSGEFLVGLRVEDAARAREGVDAGVSALASFAGFRLTRIVGLETAPDGRAVAVIAGVLPLSRLPRAMGLSAVVKIVPVGGDDTPAPAAPAAKGEGGLPGFANFVMRHGLWLLILTLLLLLPSLRAPAWRAAAVFIPYR